MTALRFIRLTLTMLYFVALFPTIFLFWAACSDYFGRGCHIETVNQCSDAVGTMQVLFLFSIFGGLICLALLAVERKMARVKVASNA